MKPAIKKQRRQIIDSESEFGDDEASNTCRSSSENGQQSEGSTPQHGDDEMTDDETMNNETVNDNNDSSQEYTTENLPDEEYEMDESSEFHDLTKETHEIIQITDTDSQ